MAPARSRPLFTHCWVVVIGTAALAGCDGEVLGLVYGGGDFEQRIDSRGESRTYFVHVPVTLAEGVPVPLVFVFHGAEQPADNIRALTAFDALADQLGWIAVYPQALDGVWASATGNDADFLGVDDVGFTADMIDQISRDLAIDPARVYATGFSNGGLMVQRLACELSDRIAAIAPVGATLNQALSIRCQLSEPVSAVYFLGTDDPSIAFEGGAASTQGQYGGEGTAREWARLNDCELDRVDTELPDGAADGLTVTRWDYADCPDSAEVTTYVVNGGGHQWPGSPFDLTSALGANTQDIGATELIGDFFQVH